MFPGESSVEDNLWNTAVALGNDYLHLFFPSLRRKSLPYKLIPLPKHIKKMKKVIKVIQGNIIKDYSKMLFKNHKPLCLFMAEWTMKTKFDKTCLDGVRFSWTCSSSHKWCFRHEWQFSCIDSPTLMFVVLYVLIRLLLGNCEKEKLEPEKCSEEGEESLNFISWFFAKRVKMNSKAVLTLSTLP